MNNNKNSLSPTPNSSVKVEDAEVLLNFGQAMELILLDKKIHKLEWEYRNYYGFLKDGVLTLHKADGKDYDWRVSEADLSGTDYVVL